MSECKLIELKKFKGKKLEAEINRLMAEGYEYVGEIEYSAQIIMSKIKVPIKKLESYNMEKPIEQAPVEPITTPVN